MADSDRVRDARNYRGQQTTLAEQFVDELRDLVGIVFGGRRPAPADAPDLVEAVAPLVRQYGSAGAALAGDFYTRQRESARLTQGFEVPQAEPISDEVVGQSVSWALRNRKSEARARLAEIRKRRERAQADAENRAGTTTADPDIENDDSADLVDVDNLDDAWESDLEGALSRHVRTPGRRTLEDAIEDDPESIAWVRITDGDPCGFCAMLAGRGFVYTTRETALYAEGTREPYHDHCGCTTMPRFRTDTSPLPTLNQEMQDLWYDGPAYFTGDAARAAMARAVRARKAGRDVRAAVFDGPKSDLDRYRRLVTHDRETVEEYRRKAQRGGRNGKPPTGPDNASDPRFR